VVEDLESYIMETTMVVVVVVHPIMEHKELDMLALVG
jgi:hypothetical protein